MKNIKILGLILAVALIAGAYFYPIRESATATVGAVGDTQSTPKMAQVQGNGNGTYITANNSYQYGSVCNTSSADWIIESIEYYFTGLTTTSTSTDSLTVKAATSSSATAAIGTNYALRSVVATSSPLAYTASTTPGNTGSTFVRTIGSGMCLNYEATATTSASVWLKLLYMQN